MDNPILKLFDDAKIAEIEKKISDLSGQILKKIAAVRELEKYMDDHPNMDYNNLNETRNEIRSYNIEKSILEDEINKLKGKKGLVRGFYCKTPQEIMNMNARRNAQR